MLNETCQRNMKHDDTITEDDLKHLRHCLRLAEDALEAGDQPFGSILVSADNEVLAEARNRINEINNLAHPEIALARWAAKHLGEEERKRTTLYTTGEHCPMCAAAHGWVGLGKIVYLSSGQQLSEWLKEMDAPTAPVRMIPIQDVTPDVVVIGPVPELADEIKELHRRYYRRG